MKNWGIGLVLMSIILSCNNSVAENSDVKADVVTISKLDTAAWIGTYSGTVPNANDIGLDMKLTLNPSNTYNLHITHLRTNPKDNIKKEFNGQIQWEDDSTTIVLPEMDSMTNIFKIKPGKVEYLNPDATPNSGNLAEFYVLKKQ